MDPQEEAEVNQLLEEWRERVEDFAVANQLDEAARNALLMAEPRVALRAMGLLGSGNAFVMHGVRKPSAAVISRIRGHFNKSGGDRPYQDWPKCLVGFSACNKLSDEVREQLHELNREQALRVMGFTTGLRFYVPLEGGNPDVEVLARIRAALEGEPMVAVEPRAPGVVPRPARSNNGNSYPFPGMAPVHRASQNNRLPPPVRHPDPMPRSRSRSHGRKCNNQFHNSDIAPFWRSNMESFIQINELDERSAQVLSELSQHDALHVMGIIGRSNSFVIRGARNTNAAVAHRIRAVQAGQRSGDEEPYANVAKMVEDFIDLNGIDERGAETMRGLSKEEALHVMGFTADNMFIFRGVKNPSASVMARIQQARRSAWR